MKTIDQKQVALNVSKVETLFSNEEKNKEEIKKLSKVSKTKQAEIDRLKAENKAINDKLVEVVTSSDVFTACAIISLSCQSGANAETAERQRMSRRRKRLTKESSKKFTDFDLITDKIKNQAVVKPVYVGDEIIRQAKAIHSKLAEYKELGLTVTVSTVETIEARLRDKKANQDTIIATADGLAVTDLAVLLEGQANEAKAEQVKRNSKKQV